MRVALAQINQIVGDFEGNLDRIRKRIDQARAAKADLIVFPELAVSGFPVLGLSSRPVFVKDDSEAIRRIAEEVRGISVILGFLEPDPSDPRNLPFNAAAVLEENRSRMAGRKTVMKRLGLWHETDIYGQGDPVSAINVAGRKVKVLVGKADLEERAGRGKADLVVALASFHVAEPGRRTLIESTARVAEAHHSPVAVLNQVGGRDELVYEGRSFVLNAKGRLCARLAAWQEDLAVFDLRKLHVIEDATVDPDEDLVEAAVLGIRDFVTRCGTGKALLGLSGGIDSAVVAGLAVRALGPGNVLGVVLPSRFTSQGSIDDAADLAARMGIEFKVIPIEPGFRTLLESLEPHFRGMPFDRTEENLQARLRGVILMSLSNKLHRMLLATGNRSEIGVGYMTMYGDTCGGLAPIADLSKAQVYRVGRGLNRTQGMIPEAIFQKAPSAELKPGQIDQDTLPPYDELDPMIARYEDEGLDADALCCSGFSREAAESMIRMSRDTAHKRRQLPPALSLVERSLRASPAYTPISHQYRK